MISTERARLPGPLFSVRLPQRTSPVGERRQAAAVAFSSRFPLPSIMGILAFILIIVILSGIIAPIAKGLGDRLAKGSPDSDRLASLKAELEQADQRLADAEQRLQLAEERLDFQEKLLSSRSSASRIPTVDR